MRIDHVAIAVNNMEEAVRQFEKILKFDEKKFMTVEHEGVRMAMLKLEDTTIEVMEPLNDDSTIKKFLTEKGEGIHHISISADDIEKDVENAEKKGVKILGGIRPGSYGRKITFIHPKSLHGVLMEFCEPHEE
ncbi:MAG: methylmalonyl-CoA epimerase [Nitrososphaerales archaeon]